MFSNISCHLCTPRYLSLSLLHSRVQIHIKPYDRILPKSGMTSSTRTPYGKLSPGEGHRITISRRCLHGVPPGSKPLLILPSKILMLFLSAFTSTKTPPHYLLRRNCGRARPRVRVPNLAIAPAWRASSPSICSYEPS